MYITATTSTLVSAGRAVWVLSWRLNEDINSSGSRQAGNDSQCKKDRLTGRELALEHQRFSSVQANYSVTPCFVCEHFIA